jgi:hypothetical protein
VLVQGDDDIAWVTRLHRALTANGFYPSDEVGLTISTSPGCHLLLSCTVAMWHCLSKKHAQCLPVRYVAANYKYVIVTTLSIATVALGTYAVKPTLPPPVCACLFRRLRSSCSWRALQRHSWQHRRQQGWQRQVRCGGGEGNWVLGQPRVHTPYIHLRTSEAQVPGNTMLP